MIEALPPWRALLRGARQREGRSPQARWLQLATLGSDGAPRVRTLVFRGWGGPSQLDLLTDRRSEKSAELAHEPRVELCWLLPKAKSQFRLRGHRLALGAETDQRARDQHWQQLQPGARSLWGWPQPGAPFDPLGPFPEALSDEVPQPESFELVRIQVEQVELLELKGHPHQRRRWRLEQDWREERLNP
ncbi:pyridoxamine 5'-phosphate oxidase family protein [Synechococcus sp. A10-1-5-1]|uniref:pyridoxamine 5'-phosphate oxidase family protein n=1 Tax=Synechococcus sp. A10-1-5-1 TaxID=2936507 RepID=UPI0020010FAF|nr:pyridoxamine 5'-phosphate oxidase family protein [Synechococcus sp. A10-1-5-1]UPM50145.1 pyridoxamine 5'-phosphate oxidase family protein [Synechococcus sp. A10-1-5-1]